MNKQISEQQLKDDFKQVVLYFNCKTIHEFFGDDPKKLIQSLEDYKRVRTDFLTDRKTVSKEQYNKIIQNLIYINEGVGIPRYIPMAMFRRGAVRTTKNFIEEMVADGELKVIGNGVLKSKVKTHFTKKYLLPMDVLIDFFADKDLAKIKLENRRLYWTKRQNRFIRNEIDRRIELKKNREVCAVKKQTEKEDSELKEQVNAVLEEMDV